MTLSKMAKTLGLGAVVVALSAGAAFAATATSAVNVRTGPGTQYRAIDTLNAGQRVDITGRNGGWCEIDQNGPGGWVSCRYLTADSGYRSYDRYDDSYDDGYYDDGPNVSFQFGFGNAYPSRPHHPGWPYGNHQPYGNGYGFSFGN